ncbi:hypothetical protein FW778_00705 [Ginsengibacter hankyongi]|uniref:Uncharacterized protein n=1 Tax=Ginsengibacter hankyongi TaxID=2607284 RepID=A0A5J5IHN9_9BACT|nr:hypothetical protein [Ginsengibacter hankyongi]KAA9040595.1 hypothetical protein FW778_00705 [Ginsengibacter hankyongi]
MHIEINDKTLLKNIQDVFSDFYPYLKIEFYNTRHKKYEGSMETDLIDPLTDIGSLRHKHVSGILEIQPFFKVADVEKEFQQHFKLSVQVFNKDKDGWRQTTEMDDFTLKELNQIGRNSSDEFIISDYEESFEEDAENPDGYINV